MNKIFNIAMILFAAVAMAACGKEDPFAWDQASEGEGSLSVKNMLVSIDDKENEVRSGSRAVDPKAFTVQIVNADDKVVEQFVYSEMPEIIALPVGQYTVRVNSGNKQEAAFDQPYYEGSQAFEIKNKQITEVQTVVCKLANVRVSVLFSETLKQHMSADTKVTVTMGAGAQLVFAADETRSGYFEYVEGSNTMVAQFSGSVDGNAEETLRAYTEVKPGNHYKITFTYAQGELPDDAGLIKVEGVNVDCTIYEEDMSINVDPGDDELIDAEPPFADDNTGGGGGDPTPPPAGSGPTVTAVAPVVLDSPMHFGQTDLSKVILDIHSDTGLTVFTLKIDSPVLPASELLTMSLAPEMDLVNPDPSYLNGLLDLGLDVPCGGKKDVSFNISDFVPLLPLLGPATSEFVITVGDASGTVTHKLIFVVD